MATVNAAREEFEAAKTRIAALRAAGKVAEEAVIRVLVILLDIIIVVLLEKTTHEPELRSAAVTDGQERAGSNGPKPNRQMGDNLRKIIVEETVAACDACGADIDGPVDRERRVLYDIVFEVVPRRDQGMPEVQGPEQPRVYQGYCNLMSGNLSEVCALRRFTGGGGLALACHGNFSWTTVFRRGISVPCHSLRSAAHCGTRQQLRGSRRCCPVSSSTAGRLWVVCEEFAFVDARGRLQLAGCMKALRAPGDRPAGAEVTDNRPPASPVGIAAEVPARAFGISRSSWSGIVLTERSR